MSLAALLATVTGVLASGVLLGPARPSSRALSIVALLALVLLAISMGLVVWASQHGGDRPLGLDELPASSANHVATIRRRTRIGMLIAAIGVALAVVPAAAVLLSDPLTSARLRLSPEGLAVARAVCPPLPSIVDVRVESAALTAASPLIRLELPPQACGDVGATQLVVRRADVAVLRVGD